MIDLNRIYALEMMRERRLADTFPAYRTNDLVLMLDGIKNQRSGGHNASATVWEDLAGNMDVTLYNATWGTNYCAFAGNTTSYGLGNYWNFTKGVTIEAVFSHSENGDRQTIAGWLSDVGVHRVGAYINSRQVRCIANTAKSVARSDTLSDGSVFAHAAFSNGFSIYNGDVETNLGPWTTGNCDYTKFRLAAWVSLSEGSPLIYPFLGSIYAVRVYDANLTVEELYAHWLIDKKRFNIPD